MFKSIGVALASLVFALGLGASAAAPVAAHPSIDIVASNWKFTPGIVTAHLNEPTTLRLTSSGGVHGIQSDELGIPSTTIMPGKFVTVTFTPKKLGTYLVHCAVFCGAGHADMVLTVKVVQ